MVGAVDAAGPRGRAEEGAAAVALRTWLTEAVAEVAMQWPGWTAWAEVRVAAAAAVVIRHGFSLLGAVGR